jgi:putative glutamine amidotransferase
MFNAIPSSGIRIGIYGETERLTGGRGVGLWSAGYEGCLSAAGAVPVRLDPFEGDESWSEFLSDVQGVVFCGWPASAPRMGDEEGLCHWCHQRRIPLLAIDNGMLALNSAFGGCNYLDLPRELPEALQHRHPPEPGVRHAIMVEPDTLICSLYGEGEIVVNSEHRQAIQRLAQGFQIGAKALDGVIEAIEWTKDSWFALGVQWQPAAGTASGLDIQVFRGVIDAAQTRRHVKPIAARRRLAASA